jgi:alpha-L-rhamnosidase
MLLARAYQSVIAVRQTLGKSFNDLDVRLERLKSNINKFYWDEEKGGFIDSFESGKRNLTKHANIFAILFNFVDEEKAAKIKRHVLLNPEINEIHTPYFKFWELEVMAKIGEYPYVIEQIKSYWGGMLDEGATTFWEYYDPNETGVEKYAMYGDKYGKSLCHAWGASPIYLIGRYLLGVRSTAPGYESYEVAPQIDLFENLSCTLPVGEGQVTIELENGQLTVVAAFLEAAFVYPVKPSLYRKNKK